MYKKHQVEVRVRMPLEKKYNKNTIFRKIKQTFSK